MREQRHAARSKPRVLSGAWDLLAEFRRELAKHGRNVDPDLFEDAAMHHALLVTMWRVFRCAAGTSGERRCASSDMPLAQNRGSSPAPGISLRNSGANSPNTVETLTPTFSKTRPCISAIVPPPPPPRCQEP